jgi:type I restriction enzyme S subunit
VIKKRNARDTDWQMVAIGDLVEPATTWTPTQSSSNHVFNYIDLSAIDQNKKLITRARPVSCREAPSRARQIVACGDVLVSTVRPNLNGVARISEQLNGATASTGFCVLRARQSKLDGGYLFHWVKSPAFIADMVKKATGASYPAVSDRIIFDSYIPLPTPTDQKRIATILDKADSIRLKRQSAFHLMDEFQRSLFLDTFGDPATNPKKFAVGTIRDLVESTSYGTSEKAHPAHGSYAVLRMNNITYKGSWDFSSLKYVDLEPSSLGKYLVHKGQILFNRTNSRELVGKTAVYRENEPMVYAGYLVRVIPKAEADAEYISGYLNSQHGKAVLQGMCKSIVGMANINAQELLSIPIALPPPELQKAFGDIVRKTEANKASHRQAITSSEDLFASLQQRAFSGDLSK